MKFLVYLAMILTYFTSSSCVPVRYNSKNWKIQKVSPKYVDNVKIDCALIGNKSNALNSNNSGPWKILFVFTSKVRGNIDVVDIEITTLQGKQIARLDEKIVVAFKQRKNLTWGAFKKTDKSIDLPYEDGDELLVNFRARGNSKTWHAVTMRFKAKHIKGTEVVNFLTM